MSPKLAAVVGALAVAAVTAIAAPTTPPALWIALCGLLLMAGGGWIMLRRSGERPED